MAGYRTVYLMGGPFDKKLCDTATNFYQVVQPRSIQDVEIPQHRPRTHIGIYRNTGKTIKLDRYSFDLPVYEWDGWDDAPQEDENLLQTYRNFVQQGEEGSEIKTDEYLS